MLLIMSKVEGLASSIGFRANIRSGLLVLVEVLSGIFVASFSVLSCSTTPVSVLDGKELASTEDVEGWEDSCTVRDEKKMVYLLFCLFIRKKL